MTAETLWFEKLKHLEALEEPTPKIYEFKFGRLMGTWSWGSKESVEFDHTGTTELVAIQAIDCLFMAKTYRVVVGKVSLIFNYLS